jgi:hypothetical protein
MEPLALSLSKGGLCEGDLPLTRAAGALGHGRLVQELG